jgi:hypothetical protein
MISDEGLSRERPACRPGLFRYEQHSLYMIIVLSA